jgi:aminoglycoside phosphotransferase (APT) family kinase protein|nr:phosphotransferase family protein [Natronomonas salsuginis]
MEDRMTSKEYTDRLVDEGALTDYLEAELGPADEYSVERFSGGHSNETLFVTWGDYDLVLRRPPPGETADSAHDVIREHHVMDALQETDVRVPTTVLACDDHDLIGSDFYVMEQEKGVVLRDEEPDRFTDPDTRRRVGAELIDRLAEIHTVDYEAVRLEGFGRPEGYTERQVDRWHQQLEWAFEVTAKERAIPPLDDVHSWLAANVPDSHPHALVHGDYKLDNVIFGSEDPPEIAGIVDWEMSTLGDPRSDLAWLLTYWRDADDPPCAIPELVPTFTDREGYPTKADIVDRYEAATDVTFEHEQFYRALAVYKLAAICEMFFRRHLEGNADNPMYPKMRERVPAMADWAVRIIEGDEPV